jgi:histidinol-phosphatase (PHP family)
MIDLHLHPDYSIDAEGSITEYCDVAKEKNLLAICFTTHLDSGPGRTDCYVRVNGVKRHVLSDEWLEDYESSIREADDTYDELQILLGVEVDLYPGVEHHLPERFHETDFDLVIGSVHLVEGNAISVEAEAREIFKKYDLNELGEHYFSLLTDSMEIGLYDIVGHIDIYRRYGEKYYGQKIHSLWEPHIADLAKRMKKYRVGFEVNTSTWRKGLNEPMPEGVLVRELVKLGIDDVTLGSDAHSPNQIGYGIDRAIQLVGDCGIQELAIYENRRPNKIPIQSHK